MDDIKVTDQEALEWASQLSDLDRAELKRQALMRRALELMEPNKAAVDVSSMTDSQLEDFKRKHGFYR